MTLGVGEPKIPPMPRSTAVLHPVVLRPARDDDAPAVATLAALDSADPPRGPLVLAEVGGRLRAALSLSDGATIADPFHPSAGLVRLLRAHGLAAE